MTTIAGFVMLLSGGLVTGGALMVAVERVWIWDQMDLPDYATDFRRSIHRADRMQPPLGLIGLIALIVFTIGSEGAARAVGAVGIVFFAVAILVSILVNQPVNREVAQSEGVLPDARALRDRWRVSHRVRTGLMVVGFALAAVAAVQ